MILVVDSGATKADWIAVDNEGKRIFSTQTKGLSPEAVDKTEIINRINERFDLSQNKEEVKKIYFYGAGCGSEGLKSIVYDALNEYFTNADVLVEEDTYGAVYATTEPGTKAIVCILGTGSNCSYFDGKKLNQKISSLGYLLMDDCSGNKLGGELVKAHNLRILPKELVEKLEAEYDMDINEVKDNLYKKSNPNAYLATFAKFVIQNKEHEFLKAIIDRHMQYFIDYYINQYENSKELPINFVGSIAFYLKDELKKKLIENGLKIGNVQRKPIDGLIDYHIKYQ
ncbi:MAG: N-acetylglucosamine kinase [Flavobacteriaceae bacterium]|jgi:N-acetylglucosamine kinase-like BadF-type ATPase|nr:N-acetylglucosamine kinase [Flavobacteriaceae bacterium]